MGDLRWVAGREYRCFGALMRAGFGKRLMFGTDQMYWPEGIGLAIEGIESAPFLTASEKRDIFYNNAVRFFRLKTGGSKRWGWPVNHRIIMAAAAPPG